MHELLAETPEIVVKYSRGMSEVARVLRQQSTMRIRSELRVTLLWGDAGTGKTKHVYDEHGVENVFTLVADNGATWFDGYEGQDVLLIDDFNGWIQYSNLLKVLDIYPYRGSVKGSFTYANWTRVYITSNYEWNSWYNAEHNKDALYRRMHTIKHFRKLPNGSVIKSVEKDSDKGIGITPPGLARASAGAGGGASAYAPCFTTPPAMQLTRMLTVHDHAPTDEELSADDASEGN